MTNEEILKAQNIIRYKRYFIEAMDAARADETADLKAMKWVKASEKKPQRQVAAKSTDGKYGVLGPWFDNTFFFYTTEFAEKEGINVTDNLKDYKWLDESADESADLQSELERVKGLVYKAFNYTPRLDSLWQDFKTENNL